MRVRIRTWLSATIGLLAFAAVAGVAQAQCNSGCQPQPPTPACCQPPPPPPPPPSPPSGCCERPPAPDYPNGNGNFNVNVNVNVNANANTNENWNNVGSSLRGRGAGDTYVGGGGAYFTVDQPYPTSIESLNVEVGAAAAAAQVIQVPVQASRWSFSRVVIRAVCIDDRDIPHPASQVQPGQELAAGYTGEIYRCIAGTRMQVTYADYLDQINFDHGQTLMCQKGESLWFQSGGPVGDAAAQYAAAYAAQYGGQYGPGVPVGGGTMECRPQINERDCNERSLLRRYGAGVKILTLWREEIYTEYQQQVVQAAAASASAAGFSITLDGGVGGRVF